MTKRAVRLDRLPRWEHKARHLARRYPYFLGNLRDHRQQRGLPWARDARWMPRARALRARNAWRRSVNS